MSKGETRWRLGHLAMAPLVLVFAGCVGEGIDDKEFAFETPEQKEAAKADVSTTEEDSSAGETDSTGASDAGKTTSDGGTITLTGCKSDAECDDGNACMSDSCDLKTGYCEHLSEKENSSCDDHDPCTGPDLCDNMGSCIGGKATDCDDGNVCTHDNMY